MELFYPCSLFRIVGIPYLQLNINLFHQNNNRLFVFLCLWQCSLLLSCCFVSDVVCEVLFANYWNRNMAFSYLCTDKVTVQNMFLFRTRPALWVDSCLSWWAVESSLPWLKNPVFLQEPYPSIPSLQTPGYKCFLGSWHSRYDTAESCMKLLNQKEVILIRNKQSISKQHSSDKTQAIEQF